MSFKPAIASMSLGRAWVHELPEKFRAAAAAGLPGIEIFFEDLLYLASSYPGGSTPSNQLLAAHSIRSLADSLSLKLIACGPFSNCEGLLSPAAKDAKLEELKLWFDICRILGTDIIQIPSTFMKPEEGVTGDFDTVVADLREIADLGAKENPPFRFAFENLCFGTFFDTWRKAWDVVEGVDRPNFGLCLDTFNIAGREFADPASEDGCTSPSALENFRSSMHEFVQTIDVNKVFYVQVVDAERLDKRLVEGHEFYVKEQKPRMSWSRNCRLFICEKERGGYLPVVEVVKAICRTKEEGGLGYKGWVSMELFNRSLTKDDEHVPVEHAERAMESWRRLSKEMGWEDAIGRENERSQSKLVRRAAEEVEISARL